MEVFTVEYDKSFNIEKKGEEIQLFALGENLGATMIMRWWCMSAFI